MGPVDANSPAVVVDVVVDFAVCGCSGTVSVELSKISTEESNVSDDSIIASGRISSLPGIKISCCGFPGCLSSENVGERSVGSDCHC